MNAPFPYFGGKRDIAQEVWSRLGSPTQYIEPFCGSAAMLLSAPRPASLEVIGDMNGFVANFCEWTRKRLTYSGSATTAEECVWFSPACLQREQQSLLA